MFIFIFAIAHARDRCGKRLKSRTHYCQLYVVSLIALLLYVVLRLLLGRNHLVLFPGFRLQNAFLSMYVRSFLPPDVFNDFV